MTGVGGLSLTSPIVVGVSRRTASVPAVRWAAAEAQLRSTYVVALCAWRGPRLSPTAGGKPSAVSAVPPEQAFDEERERLEMRLAASLGNLEALRISFDVRRGPAATVLLKAAVGAQLLVLDSPRSGGLATVGKSWIAPQIVFQSPCPVVLMPPQELDDPALAVLHEASEGGQV